MTRPAPGPAAPELISARAVMQRLVRPLNLPSAVYSVGVGAAILAQVLVGLAVGLSPSTVALVMALSGVVMVLGTWGSGAVVERLGERRALALATVTGIAPAVELCAQQEVLLPLWAAREEGLSPEMVSTAMGVSLALEMVLFYPAGAVLDRIGSLPVVCGCLAVMTTGFALLLVPGAFWPAIVLIGLGGGIGSGIVKTIELQLAPARGRPRFLARWSALAAAGAIGGPLLVALAGSVSITAAVRATVAAGVTGTIWLAAQGRPHLGR